MKKRKNMKLRGLAFILAVLMTIGLAGCSILGEEKLAGYAEKLDTLRGLASQNAAPTTAAPTGYAPDVFMEYEMYDVDAGMPALSGAAEYYMPDWNTEEYNYYEENGWHSAAVTPFSTFAADVDTASYANIRRMILREGSVVPDAVRIEEMVNYFTYDYPQPQEGEPFSVTTEIAPCPWNENAMLLLIGLQAEELKLEERAPSNLVFLIDVSGSMDEPDKLPLVQRAFQMLSENMKPEDTISIVTYADGNTVVLEGATGEDAEAIRTAIEDLEPGGGTNGADGINTAYAIAEKYFIEGGSNRVILATDGDLNIGVTDEGSLTRLIQEKAKSGVYLSVLGFGTGNISDARMQALADNGNGNYSYIDDVTEARRVLIDEMGGTLFTVAKDVKLQVEFNPALVKGYHLIGYESRLMDAEDFADDDKDGGEIGAGHRVTVLYEIALAGSKQEIGGPEPKYTTQTTTDSDELLTVNIRYKAPDGDESMLLEYPVSQAIISDEMSENMTWAAGVAAFGMILKDSEFVGDWTAEDVKALVKDLPSVEGDAYREEFLYLLTKSGK